MQKVASNACCHICLHAYRTPQGCKPRCICVNEWKQAYSFKRVPQGRLLQTSLPAPAHRVPCADPRQIVISHESVACGIESGIRKRSKAFATRHVGGQRRHTCRHDHHIVRYTKHSESPVAPLKGARTIVVLSSLLNTYGVG